MDVPKNAAHLKNAAMPENERRCFADYKERKSGK